MLWEQGSGPTTLPWWQRRTTAAREVMLAHP
jgi:hypothetical protein